MDTTRHSLGLIVGLVLAGTAVASAGTVTYNRAADFAAATNINDGDNSHGGVTDPSGNLWSYAYLTAADRTADGEAPADFQPVNAVSATTYEDQVFGAGGLDSDFIVTATTLTNYWNKPNGDPTPALAHADLMAVFTTPSNGTYSITGTLQWEQLTTANGSGAQVFVGKIVGGTFSFLMQQNISTGTLNVFNDITLSGLIDLTLSAGDGLVFGIRGNGAQYRKMVLDDSGATITEVLAVPEPMTGALLSLGVLAGVGRRRRRRDRSGRMNRHRAFK